MMTTLDALAILDIMIPNTIQQSTGLVLSMDVASLDAADSPDVGIRLDASWTCLDPF